MSSTTTLPFQVFSSDYLSTAYKRITGNLIDEFQVVQGHTPFFSQHEVLKGCVVYLTVIFGGQVLMKNREPFKCKSAFQVHNGLLTLVSGVLLLLLLEQLVPQLYHHGFVYAICSRYAWTPKHELLYYLNYLVKWWELGDTVFLFLHYFHHSMTMLLCFVQLEGRSTVSWVPIVLNLIVHIFMYYYYYCASAGIQIWWKRYLTSMQIIQFVIDLCVIYSAVYTTLVFYHFSDILPHFGTCAGTGYAASVGCLILTSYLFLFIQFYRRTYRKVKKA